MACCTGVCQHQLSTTFVARSCDDPGMAGDPCRARCCETPRWRSCPGLIRPGRERQSWSTGREPKLSYAPPRQPSENHRAQARLTICGGCISSSADSPRSASQRRAAFSAEKAPALNVEPGRRPRRPRRCRGRRCVAPPGCGRSRSWRSRCCGAPHEGGPRVRRSWHERRPPTHQLPCDASLAILPDQIPRQGRAIVVNWQGTQSRPAFRLAAPDLTDLPVAARR